MTDADRVFDQCARTWWRRAVVEQRNARGSTHLNLVGGERVDDAFYVLRTVRRWTGRSTVVRGTNTLDYSAVTRRT